MPARFVLDASAVLCLVNAEPGAEVVRDALNDAIVSTVNYSEVVSKLVERGATPAMVRNILDPLHLELIDLDGEQAVAAGALRAVTREAGLSLGERVCLALAASRNLVALTTDGDWSKVQTGAAVQQLR